MPYTAQDLTEMLNVAGDGVSHSVASLNELVDVAMRSRADLAQTVGFYLKVELGGRHSGASKHGDLQAIQTVNQSFVVCGTPPSDQKLAIAAITQTVARGEMGIDEFRVIAETVPVLATALADEIGVSVRQLIGRLRVGRIIAADQLFAALRAIEHNVAQAFAQTHTTVAQAENKRRTMDLMREFRANGDGRT